MCAPLKTKLMMNSNEPFEFADRDFISGIYNYCDRWCEKCPFTSRCRVYAMEAADADLADAEVHDINNLKFWRKLETIFEEARETLAGWAEEAGIDLDSIGSQTAMEEHDQRAQEADEHQLSELARQYARTVQEWFEEELVGSLSVHDDMTAEAGEDIDVSGAAEVIRWYQFFVAAKVIRALMSQSRAAPPLEVTGDDDPFPESAEEGIDDADAFSEVVHDDGNGSAKIALIAIDRSMAAWHAMEMSLPQKSDSIAPIFAELERLRWLLEQEFPNAREFIRPGFDEADTELVN